MKILSILIAMLMIVSCSNKKSSDKRDSVEKTGHGEGIPGEPIPEDTNVLLETLLQMDPLADGHMMADIMNSNRDFRPDEGHGFWETVGFSWVTDAPASTYIKDKELSLTFTSDTEDPTECRLDNGAWEACAGTFTASGLAEGTHEVHVRSGSSKITVGAYRFVADFTPPTVFKVTDTVTGNLLVMGNETLSSIQCLIDQEEVNCQEGAPANTVSGPLSVTAVDLAGNSTSIEL
jgi:hypothetical protein